MKILTERIEFHALKMPLSNRCYTALAEGRQRDTNQFSNFLQKRGSFELRKNLLGWEAPIPGRGGDEILPPWTFFKGGGGKTRIFFKGGGGESNFLN